MSTSRESLNSVEGAYVRADDIYGVRMLPIRGSIVSARIWIQGIGK